MRLCAVQCRPLTGDVARNLAAHVHLARQATELGADLVLFPELSLTGYEPELAGRLSTVPDDSRLDALQALSDAHRTAIAVGLPVRSRVGVHIGMVILRPARARLLYLKQHLATSEEAYFVPGSGFATFAVAGTAVAPAICYELSVPDHAATAAAAGAEVYAASVAKTAGDAGRAGATLAAIAQRYAIPVVMANAVGPCDGDSCAGNSSAWGANGALLARLQGPGEGLVVLDTSTGEAFVAPVAARPARPAG